MLNQLEDVGLRMLEDIGAFKSIQLSFTAIDASIFAMKLLIFTLQVPLSVLHSSEPFFLKIINTF